MAEDNSWHRDFGTWKERNAFLFKNEIMSDCSFVIIDGNKKTKIPAHKYILGGNSAEFYNLFYLMRSSRGSSSDEIRIEDISVDNLTVFLEFLYTEKCHLTMENVEVLLKLAKRYSVHHFEKICGEFILKTVNEDTAFAVMDTYSDYKFSNLLTTCVKLISKNELSFESPIFYTISLNTLTELLKSEELKGFKEIAIYNGVNKWAENFCKKNNQIINSENKRLAIKPALQYIRFASMELNDFALCTLNNSILTPSEVLQIIQFIGSNGETECKFSAKKRNLLLQTLRIDWKDDQASLKGNCYFTHYKIFTISVNKPIHFHGFGMVGRTEKSLEKPDLWIIQLKQSDTVLLESLVEINYDGTDKTYDLLFDNSICLKPNIQYTAYIHSDKIGSVEYFYSRDFKTINKEFDGVWFNVHTEIPNYFFKSIYFSQ